MIRLATRSVPRYVRYCQLWFRMSLTDLSCKGASLWIGGIPPRREGGAQGDMEDQVPHPYRFPNLMRAKGIPIRPLAVAPPRRSQFPPHIMV
ncbi:UNVERIFIED_CONTAM: hypothetical protein Sangu_2244000 [Sesamum angustifolium]|uniref:Uncharacterized protein n=1 Tax=Sesamum angustifolium TaxID=2727405 RepID=A0AAW2L3X8_9LAMI